MRGCFTSIMAVVTIVPSILLAQSDEIPTLDVRPVCRGIAKQSAVGKKDQAETFQRCTESEHAVREQLRNVWAGFSRADKEHCVTLAKIGGLPSYTELITCLEMVRDVRALRSGAGSSSAAETTTPTSSSSMPSAESASQPTPTKEPSKTEKETSVELEQAKAEAQTAKASEALTQRKLADVEAALQGTKEEVGRATAEADRARADAQAARESEAAVKRKLAEVEAARAAAEQACLSSARPGLAARLRELFKRPSSKNP